MPLVGWAAGMTFSLYIRGFDHWIAFGLLAFVGGRMIISGLPRKNKKKNEDGESANNDCRHLPTLFILSVATSIDAMAIGLSFAMIKISILLPAAIIGVVTFFVCLLGYFLGKKIGEKINLELDLVGGLILVGIGTKILLEHLFQ
jgi:putative Mn2+ efflux pump MntP